jgi:hypothetical protein
VPNQIFKFLNSEHVDHVLRRGTIRISTFSYYRSLEKPGIGDRTEASTIVNVDQTTLIKGATEPWRPEGFMGAFASAAESTLILNNVVGQYNHPDCFIFCVSGGDRDPLIEAMCFKATEPYDACLRLLIPPQLLAHRILWRGRVQELHDTPVRSLFRTVDFGPVTYDAIEYNHADGQAPFPSPFKKRPLPEFVSQSEARIVLSPSHDLGFQQLTISLPRIEKIFIEEFRSLSEAKALFGSQIRLGKHPAMQRVMEGW